MKTIQLSVSLSRAAGGIFEIEQAMSKQLQSLGLGVTALGLLDSRWGDDANSWSPIGAEVFPIKGPGVFGFSPPLQQRMLELEADLVHLHYMWMFPSVAVSRWAAATGKPYLVTPNGMLEPWALRNAAWKKKLAGFLYENRMLHGAACFQANTEKELRDIRAYGLNNPVCIIPNGIDLPEDRGQGSGVRDKESGRMTLLFLGRLHPKKGLVNALKAWAKIRGQGTAGRGQEEWQFVIAGWDQGGHEAELKRLCKDLGLAYAESPASEFLSESWKLKTENSQIVFVGPAFGQDKETLLRSASAFILPSFSEGLPMSVLEAWSYRLPVLMTDECNIPEGFAADAALRIGPDTESIAAGLHSLFASQVSDLTAMGDRGRSLVERQFTWPMVAAQMKEVYEWVLGGGSPSSSVVL